MNGIVELFMQLPRLFEELAKRPIRTIAFLIGCVVLSVAIVANMPKREVKQVEKPEPERRITKIAKWLWEKE